MGDSMLLLEEIVLQEKSTYYARLRKLREKVCRNIVSIEPETSQRRESEIKISSGEIIVTLPSDASAETISTVLMALKSC